MKHKFYLLTDALTKVENILDTITTSIANAKVVLAQAKELINDMQELWQETEALVQAVNDEFIEPIRFTITQAGKEALAQAEQAPEATLDDEVEALEADIPFTLAEVVKSNRYYVLDTETTGLGTEDVIIEIAIIDQDGTTIMNTLVNPNDVAIDYTATQITGITEEMVQNEPSFALVYAQLMERLNPETPIIIYNADFDMRMLKQSAAANGMTPTRKTNPVFCAMKTYAEFKGEWNSYHNNYKWHRLTDACRSMGIPLQNAHRALGDAQMTLALVKAMYPQQ